MRHLRLTAAGALAGMAVLAACNDSTPTPSGPDTAEAFHFDSLAFEASSSSEQNRVAALDLALRALADGGTPGTLQLTTSQTSAPESFSAVAWSAANVVQTSTADSATDSVMVIVAWRDLNADSMLVIRTGHASLFPPVQSELATLGLTGILSGDSLQAAAIVSGNTVTLADSGLVNAQFGVLGAGCSFITVASVTNDSGSGANCDLALIDFAFALRFSPSALWGLNAGASPGVVILR
jgi:hypothetical protein